MDHPSIKRKIFYSYLCCWYALFSDNIIFCLVSYSFADAGSFTKSGQGAGGKRGDSFLSEFNNVVLYEPYVFVFLCEAFL
jgi:hypothetical protein